MEWLGPRLADPRTGVVTVVFHSITLLYFSGAARERVSQILHEAGERATREAPLAWLSLEPGQQQTDWRLAGCPGGGRRRVSTAGYRALNPVLLSLAETCAYP